MLSDVDIQAMVRTRMADVSSLVRECALDIVLKNMWNLRKIEDGRASEARGGIDGLWNYIQMVLARANFETSLTVRKKMTQILSMALDSDLYDDEQESMAANTGDATEAPRSLRLLIIKTMFLKWIDASSSVKQSMISSIQHLIKQPSKEKRNYEILFDIVGVLTENHEEFLRRDQYSN